MREDYKLYRWPRGLVEVTPLVRVQNLGRFFGFESILIVIIFFRIGNSWKCEKPRVLGELRRTM